MSQGDATDYKKRVIGTALKRGDTRRGGASRWRRAPSSVTLTGASEPVCACTFLFLMPGNSYRVLDWAFFCLALLGFPLEWDSFYVLINSNSAPPPQLKAIGLGFLFCFQRGLCDCASVESRDPLVRVGSLPPCMFCGSNLSCRIRCLYQLSHLPGLQCCYSWWNALTSAATWNYIPTEYK